MRHRYACPMRWADLDMLGHVNNVVYVDYLQEARVDMLRAHTQREYTRDLVDGVVVVRHEVSYVNPLTFSFEPVLIECWVTEVRAASFTLAYEVFRETDEGRTVFVRARTLLAPYVFATERPRRITPEERAQLERFLEPEEPEKRPAHGPFRRLEAGHFPVHVRFSDVDVYGHVNNVKYFEYLQEARILLFARLWEQVGDGQPEASFVVARTDVDYLQPILMRAEPYDAWSWVSALGTRSVTVESELRDGDTVLARARVVLVFFDAEKGRSTEPAEAYREALLALAAR